MRAAGRGCRAGSGRGHRRVAVAQAATEVRAGNGRDARAAGATGVRGAGRDHRRGRSGSGGAGRSHSSGHRSAATGVSQGARRGCGSQRRSGSHRSSRSLRRPPDSSRRIWRGRRGGFGSGAPRRMRGALRRGGSGRGRRGGFVEEAGAFLFLAEERAGRRASQEAGRKREGRMSHQNDVPSLVFLVVGDH